MLEEGWSEGRMNCEEGAFAESERYFSMELSVV